MVHHFIKPTLTQKLSALCLLLSFMLAGACKNQSDNQVHEPKGMFTLLDSSSTVIGFANTLTKGLNTNAIIYQYFYSGGGAAIVDVNGDAPGACCS